MSARDRDAARYRLHQALEFWQERWVLDGLYVSCPGCYAQQMADDAREPFLHVDGCAMATDFAKHPWVELRDLLADLAAVPT
ncbi:hypothetical protein [Pseudomonas yamanorum]|uniref:hypothetical protein n=1 Tax=Pseudomonas yamanorum TaxID=515393 RepID=UPI00087B4FAB|nr:hypothetical protein [Pseudomonas yamanorum]SDT94026.1 hypothetical protein SAMN05216237_0567 [Pseudomonas yamanorum]